MAKSVIAQKTINGKTVTRPFTELSWKHLGKLDKDGLKQGWQEISDIKVFNTQPTIPATGNVKEIKVKAEEIKKENEPEPEIKVLSEDDKQKFISTVLADLNKDTIKNFFDAPTIKQAYSTKDNIDKLKIQLAEYLGYSEEKFKENF